MMRRKRRGCAVVVAGVVTAVAVDIALAAALRPADALFASAVASVIVALAFGVIESQRG